ncbi:hypothetical protein LPB72_22855 [Hydrogenophaga crassostreae]|uniref:DUF4148 domain-containing protein n=1 Tax=Hydrogenophaga crassostreae TaxID=1763535 RepID=A0A167GA99_9BURK|nr:DUF4148 domain-containing protein [Hydrogenophaga crassostreae]AOW11577.1 hypothetical protein LPB072_00580 [Hydrogenophaga crassostreae]OAD39176.1 hypothetical protein LPB72_22855 [Hydrogenophaga crassostreae]
MKSLVIATLLAATAFSASAMSGNNGELYPQDQDNFVSTKTRAEVIAEMREARAAGTIAYGDADIKRINARPAPSTSTLTRAEVLMEVADLAAQGKLYPNGNANGGIYRN